VQGLPERGKRGRAEAAEGGGGSVKIVRSSIGWAPLNESHSELTRIAVANTRNDPATVLSNLLAGVLYKSHRSMVEDLGEVPARRCRMKLTLEVEDL